MLTCFDLVFRVRARRSTVAAITATALHPGAGAGAVDLGSMKKSGGSGKWVVVVPLVRGAAMVTATLH